MGPAPRLSAQAAASKVRGRPWRGHRRLLVAWRPGITSGNFQCKGLEKCYEIWGIIYIYILIMIKSWVMIERTTNMSWNIMESIQHEISTVELPDETNTHFINTSLGHRRIEFHRSRTYLLTPLCHLRRVLTIQTPKPRLTRTMRSSAMV